MKILFWLSYFPLLVSLGNWSLVLLVLLQEKKKKAWLLFTHRLIPPGAATANQLPPIRTGGLAEFLGRMHTLGSKPRCDSPTTNQLIYPATTEEESLEFTSCDIHLSVIVLLCQSRSNFNFESHFNEKTKPCSLKWVYWFYFENDEFYLKTVYVVLVLCLFVWSIEWRLTVTPPTLLWISIELSQLPALCESLHCVWKAPPASSVWAPPVFRSAMLMTVAFIWTLCFSRNRSEFLLITLGLSSERFFHASGFLATCLIMTDLLMVV